MHATHTLHPRVFWQSAQQSATDVDLVAPGPEPGTITLPSYSVCAEPVHVPAEVVASGFGGGGDFKRGGGGFFDGGGLGGGGGGMGGIDAGSGNVRESI